MAHKYVHPPFRSPRTSQEVLVTHACELDIGNGKIPSVATVEEERITYYDECGQRTGRSACHPCYE